MNGGQQVSIFAWLGEAIRPGPVGKIEFGKPLKRTRRRIVVLIRFTAAVAIVVLLLRYVLLDINNHWIQGAELILVAAFVYLVLGYFVHPRAETSSMGWLGGLVDNPFRLSDDINRWLVLLEIILLPGRFISSSFVEFVILLFNAKRTGQQKG
jgi:hypothetical protein